MKFWNYRAEVGESLKFLFSNNLNIKENIKENPKNNSNKREFSISNLYQKMV
jgi:hypothetical protein